MRPSVEAIGDWLADRLSRRTGVAKGAIEGGRPFSYYGLGSLDAVELASELEAWLGRPVSPTLTWSYPTIDAVAWNLGGGEADEDPVFRGAARTRAESDAIAVSDWRADSRAPRMSRRSGTC